MYSAYLSIPFGFLSQAIVTIYFFIFLVNIVIGLAIVVGILMIMLIAALVQQCREGMKHNNHSYTNAANISDDERDAASNMLTA